VRLQVRLNSREAFTGRNLASQISRRLFGAAVRHVVDTDFTVGQSLSKSYWGHTDVRMDPTGIVMSIWGTGRRVSRLNPVDGLN
jgi:hypothetical protein